MQDEAKGTRRIGQIIDNTQSKPLTHIKRQGKDEVGYATEPWEIDKLNATGFVVWDRRMAINRFA